MTQDPRLLPENQVRFQTPTGHHVVDVWPGPRDGNFHTAAVCLLSPNTALAQAFDDAANSPISPREKAERIASAGRAALATAEREAAPRLAEGDAGLRHVIATAQAVTPMKDQTFAEVTLDQMLWARLQSMTPHQRAATIATAVHGGAGEAFAEMLVRMPTELTGLPSETHAAIASRLLRTRKPTEAAAITLAVAQHRVAVATAKTLIDAAARANVNVGLHAPTLARIASAPRIDWPEAL